MNEKKNRMKKQNKTREKYKTPKQKQPDKFVLYTLLYVRDSGVYVCTRLSNSPEPA